MKNKSWLEQAELSRLQQENYNLKKHCDELEKRGDDLENKIFSWAERDAEHFGKCKVLENALDNAIDLLIALLPDDIDSIESNQISYFNGKEIPKYFICRDREKMKDRLLRGGIKR